MKLTYEQIKEITVGAAYVEQTDGKIVFHRFTKAEEELYCSVGYKLFKKAFANSCIWLEFKTDSASLHLKTYLTPRSSRTFYSHDIFVNDTLCGILGGSFDDIADNVNGGIADGLFRLGEKGIEKTVRIHLPWSCSSDIIELSLDDGATLSPVKKNKKMIFYGDSITQGYDATYTSNSYASRVALSLNAEARNKGIGGEIFRPELAKIKNNDFDAYIITVAYGTNDWNENISRETLTSRTNDFIGALSENYPSAKIFAIAPIWRADYTDSRAFGEFREIRNCFEEICNRYKNVALIDGFDFVPHESNLFSDKSLHPNDEGFAYYAEKLVNEINKHL